MYNTGLIWWKENMIILKILLKIKRKRFHRKPSVFIYIFQFIGQISSYYSYSVITTIMS